GAGPSVGLPESPGHRFHSRLYNNLNNQGPLASGRREINWDGGGGVDTTTAPVTPFNVFLDSRGGQFTTPGGGLSQAPPSGLVGLFNNPTYDGARRTLKDHSRLASRAGVEPFVRLSPF